MGVGEWYNDGWGKFRSADSNLGIAFFDRAERSQKEGRPRVVEDESWGE